MSDFLPAEKALGMYKKMYEIRKYEESIYYLFLEGIMPGTIHQSTGEEASAVGMLYDLRKDDWMASTHRPAGHDLAKGISVKAMMCEMFGKADGCCGGKGGAMHTGDASVGAMTANAIVGGNLPIAAGVALAFKMQKKDNVVVCFFGDGASNEGSYHETMNAAGLWKLPVIYVCENNQFGMTVPTWQSTSVQNIADRAAGYGIPGEVVDGNDVVAVYEAFARAKERALKGEGPTLLECKTYRWRGHWTGDPEPYRTREEVEEWKEKRDPIKLFRAYLTRHKLATKQELDDIEAAAAKKMEAAVEFAMNSPEPDPAHVLDDVFYEG